MSKSSNLDMSLDDLIAANKKSGGSGKGGKGRSSKGKGGGGAGSKGKGTGGKKGGSTVLRAAGSITKALEGSWKSAAQASWGGGGKGKGKSKGKGGSSGYGVKVEGLDFSIMPSDLLELFSSMGSVSRAWIDFDSTDRSEGTGGATFDDYHEAEEAARKYNGRQIEGRAMTVYVDEWAAPQPGAGVGNGVVVPTRGTARARAGSEGMRGW